MINKKVFEEKKSSFERAKHPISFETGKLAVQTDATVLVKYQGNDLLFTLCMDKNPHPDKDFLPLMIDFRESYSAAGRIAWALYRRRESKASDGLILYSRLTDRALRPMFPKGMINDLVLSITPMQISHTHPLGVMSIIGSSLVVMASGIPFDGPVAAAQISYKDGNYIINPSYEELEWATLDLLVAGKKWSINMIEAWANEVPKDILKKAFELWQAEIDKACDLQKEFLTQLTINTPEISFNKPSDTTLAYVSNILTSEKLNAMTGKWKVSFNDLFYQYQEEVLTLCKDKIEDDNEEDFTESKVKMGVFTVVKNFLRKRTLETGKRVDDRDEMTIRDLYCETDLFERNHGSALFRRWETQVLTTTTLWWPRDYLLLDDMEHDWVKKRYFHHYNFPPFSVWDARNVRFLSRREIWHGRLAEKALEPMLPSSEEFPYSIRTVSECLGSGGSTSMWATCASTMSLMTAWVPIKKPVSGIAMWMFSEHTEDWTITNYRILNDIMWTEDFTGDMDFKVAGTKDWITAIQLDTKVKWLHMALIHEVIDRAFDGYNEILWFMLQTISAPRDHVNQYAPKIFSFKVNPDKIKDVIGKGGDVINKIIEMCDNIKIDFEEDGTCFLTHPDQAMIDKALWLIKDIVEDLEIGQIYDWKVARIESYGLFVDLPKGKSALCHISQLGPKFDKDLNKSFKIWDPIKVKLIGIDERGRLKVKRELS